MTVLTSKLYYYLSARMGSDQLLLATLQNKQFFLCTRELCYLTNITQIREVGLVALAK